MAQREHQQIGSVDGERLDDGSRSLIGRAYGMRRMQLVVFFYFFI